jgi:hypothetical protein
MTPENAGQIREQLLELGAGGDEWRDFNYAWGAIAGEEALAFASESEEEDMEAVMSGWAAAKPQEALALLENLPENYEDQRRQITQSVVTGLADADQGMATDFVLRLAADGNDRADNWMRIVANEALRSGGVEEASAWADGLPDGDVKGSAMDRIAGTFVREDPEAAASWAEQYADQDYAARVIEEVGDEWSEREPEAAVAWLDGLPEGRGQNEGLNSAFGEWEDRDPEAAGNYLLNMPTSDKRDNAIRGFADGYAWQDPETSLAWAGAISNPEVRNDSIQRVGRVYWRRDREAAQAWLESSNLAPEVKESIRNGRGGRPGPPLIGSELNRGCRSDFRRSSRGQL